MRKQSEQVLKELFPKGIPPEQYDLAMRIANAVDRVLGGGGGQVVDLMDALKTSLDNAKGTPADRVERENEEFLGMLRAGVTLPDLMKHFGLSRAAANMRILRLQKDGAKIERTYGPVEGRTGRPTTTYRMVKAPKAG